MLEIIDIDYHAFNLAFPGLRWAGTVFIAVYQSSRFLFGVIS